MTDPITSLARRVLLATECDERSEVRALVHSGPATSCAALGSVVAHVIATLTRDRKLVHTWLEKPKGAKA